MMCPEVAPSLEPDITQMSCSGGSAKGLFTPDVIRCLNSGSSYSSEDVEWTCTASLPPEFKLGSTDVICEGYESAKDDYVLKGSCAVEYRLVLTDIGEEKYGSSWTRGFRQSGAEGGTSPFVATLFWVLFVGVAAWMIYSAFVRRTNNTGNIPRSWGGGGGGGGGGGDGTLFQPTVSTNITHDHLRSASPIHTVLLETEEQLKQF